MADNFQKTPLARSVNQTAQNRVADAIQILGKALPATVVSAKGSIVTVAFQVTSAYTLPQVTVPLAGSEYVRYPIQAGCKGVIYPADVPLGAMSGLGSGAPPLTTPPNLTALVFFPCGNTGFFAVNPNTLTLYGEPNVLVQDKTGSSQILTTSNSITLTAGGHTLVISAAGIVLDGKVFATHMHTDVQFGSSDTGPVA